MQRCCLVHRSLALLASLPPSARHLAAAAAARRPARPHHHQLVRGRPWCGSRAITTTTTAATGTDSNGSDAMTVAPVIDIKPQLLSVAPM